MENHENKQKDFIHERLLHVMDFFHSVCVSEHISYSLIGGSLIGAVRHKGIIPWDDDIDVVMTRSEFERFEKVINSYCDNSGEFIYVTDNRRVPIVAYKVEPKFENMTFFGIRVDIFIIDNLPDNLKKRKKLLFKMKVVQGMMHKGKLNWSRYSLRGKIQLFGTRVLGLFRSYKSLIKSYRKLSTMYNGIETKQQFISNDIYSMFSIPYEKAWFNKVILSPFEGREFFIFSEYDCILKSCYGDYMQLPPESERVFSHTEIKIVEGN